MFSNIKNQLNVYLQVIYFWYNADTITLVTF